MYELDWIEYRYTHENGKKSMENALFVACEDLNLPTKAFQSWTEDSHLKRENWHSANHLVYEGIHIFYGNAHNGIHVVITGEACRVTLKSRLLIEFKPYRRVLIKFIERIRRNGAVLKRVDMQRTFRSSCFVDKCEEHSLPYREFRYGYARTFKSVRSEGGKTLYYGKRPKEDGSCLRIYQPDGGGENGDIVRIEVESRGKSANQLIDGWILADSAYVAQFIHSRVVFRDVPDQLRKHPERAPVMEFWIPVIDGKSKVNVPIPRKPIVDDNRRTAKWLSEQVKPKLSDLMSDPEGLRYFLFLIGEVLSDKYALKERCKKRWNAAQNDRSFFISQLELRSLATLPFVSLINALIHQQLLTDLSVQAGRETLARLGLLDSGTNSVELDLAPPSFDRYYRDE